jgi:hypothetical protein
MIPKQQTLMGASARYPASKGMTAALTISTILETVFPVLLGALAVVRFNLGSSRSFRYSSAFIGHLPPINVELFAARTIGYHSQPIGRFSRRMFASPH